MSMHVKMASKDEMKVLLGLGQLFDTITVVRVYGKFA